MSRVIFVLVLSIVTRISQISCYKPTVSLFISPTNVQAGSKVKMVCTVSSGTPPFKFVWTKDHFPLQSDDQVKISDLEDTSLVTIDSSGARHNGNYSCFVSNIHGSDTRTAAVVVKGNVLIAD